VFGQVGGQKPQTTIAYHEVETNSRFDKIQNKLPARRPLDASSIAQATEQPIGKKIHPQRLLNGWVKR
jgi:hypothetical protein